MRHVIFLSYKAQMPTGAPIGPGLMGDARGTEKKFAKF
jgi:hypothetical protein